MKQRTVQVADIRNLDLANTCTYMAQKYAQDKELVSGAAFAFLAKRLVNAEVRPGGPYKDADGEPTARVNIAVAHMFWLMGKPLPQVEAFITGQKKLTQEERFALARYKRAQAIPPATSPAYSAPYRLARKTLRHCDEPLRSQALAFLARVAAADTTKEIACIAAFTAQSFGARIPRTTLHRLGEANIYTWISYMIYDHLIDGEALPAALPVANVTMRLALARYSAVCGQNPAYARTIAQHFNGMDEANAWELKHCRFVVEGQTIHIRELPDYAGYDILARRSGGHILGPLAIATLVQPKNTYKNQRLASGLRQYLIARQLSDDLHDWKADLAVGLISPVVAQLLHHGGITPGTYDIPELTERLQHDFLRDTMGAVCDQITRHSKSAAMLLQTAGCAQTGKLIKLVDRLAKMAAASRAEQSRFVEFSRQYSQ